MVDDTWESDHSTKLPEEHVAPLMASVVQALHYLHTIGLIHRDIKPGNILIDENGSAKVADFGMSYYEQSRQRW